jgi:hypothetical protein
MVPNGRVKQLVTALAVVLLASWGAAIASAQAYYPSPEEAVGALLAALQSDDPKALRAVLGPEVDELGSGDPVADAAARARFVEGAAERHRIEPRGEDRAELVVGADDWPFAIPLVRDAQGWRFDTAAGKEELINRRIGGNELHAIATARAYVEAQHEYAARDPQGEGLRQYAQRFGSREGKRDGLFWPTAEGEPESPLGPLVAAAVREGYSASESGDPSPYHGYYYRILAAQGEHAPGGAHSYLQDGRMTRGFGLVAYPAAYGSSGIMTFIVNDRGLMFQKDLGEDTEALAARIEEYDPDPSWSPVVED